MTNNLYKLSALLLILVFFGCSTEKDKRVNRFYHNTTAYYNGYFNAREIIKEKNKEFDKNVPEDFSVQIPVNRYPNEEQSKGYFPEMNRAIGKTERVISKHAMPKEKIGKKSIVEYGNWMDENWFVMGKAYFYKREYPQAIERFKYIVKMYPKDESKYYAKLWLAKTFIEMEDFPKALKYLNEIENEKIAKELKDSKKKAKDKRRKKYTKKRKTKRKKSRVKILKKREKLLESRSVLVEFPEKMDGDLQATFADYYLRNGEIKQSVLRLDSAISLASKKKLKIRYKFIQAQLCQKLGKNSKASDLYEYVSRKSDVYQMVFYSKINRALLASSSNRPALKKDLLELAKDEKYAEFRDQIYYALADLELQEENKLQGIEYLEKSASFPPSTKLQKGKTFIRLANIYYEDKAYISANKYYDSSLTVLPKEYKERPRIEEINVNLTRLVSYLDNIALQDSLLQIGGLSEKKRRDRAEEILYAEKIKKFKPKTSSSSSSTPTATLPTSTIGTQKGSFWIYNESAKAFGYKEFKSKWGDIKLEDDWRRSTKRDAIGTDEEFTEDGLPVVSDKEIDEFLKNIPTSEEDITKTTTSLISSYYLSGLIYKDILNNDLEAIKSFTTVKKRFHPNYRITPSLYQLYKIREKESIISDINVAKNFILNEYPKSQEAKIIRDPNYAKSLLANKSKNKDFYERVYTLSKNKKNEEVIRLINSGLDSSSVNPYECKLKYLRAMAYSNLENNEMLEVSLKNIVESCASTEIGDAAQTALNKLLNINAKKAGESEKPTYIYAPESPHYFVLVVPNTADINQPKIGLSNFNSTSFDEKGLKTVSIPLDKTSQTILVKEFKNKKDAHSYYVAFKVESKLKNISTKFQYFTISAKNYSALFVLKNVEDYQKFFKAKYF